MNNHITADHYVKLVAALLNGMAQNPAIIQYADSYQISNITQTALQGVEQCLSSNGITIIPEQSK